MNIHPMIWIPLVVIAIYLSSFVVEYGVSLVNRYKMNHNLTKIMIVDDESAGYAPTTSQPVIKEPLSASTTELIKQQMLTDKIVKKRLPLSALSNIEYRLPIKKESLGLFVTERVYADENSPCNPTESEAEYYEVANASFQGSTITIYRVMASIKEMFMCYFDSVSFVAAYNNEYYFLSKLSSELSDRDGLIKEKLFIDDFTKLDWDEELPPDVIVDNGKQSKFFIAKSRHDGFFGNIYPEYFRSIDQILFQDDDLTVYQMSDGFAFTVSHDGTITDYRVEDLRDKAKSVVFDDQTVVNIADYSPTLAGKCGGVRMNILQDPKSMGRCGKASNGQDVMCYTDEQNIKNYYDMIYYPGETEEKISFEEFLKMRPYFIWTDAYGRTIEYRLDKLQPAAECAKPVIYLYPEKDMRVSVKVEPNGGFKFTEPAYGSGWNVWATTDSRLTNMADGASYPYLFWEGKAYDYSVPGGGFVLKREHVGRDMKILLARLGLNEKETADFMEFWQPKLEVKPFVYVTFLPQTEFDKLAPLTVVPAPDKIIRVFMDYEPLDQFVYVSPLKITTPTRTGFTVVEWGGRLR